MHAIAYPSLRCGKHQLDLTHAHVMGILNVTPDSFSDGGNFNSLDSAISHAEHMLNAGVDIIDIGGESSRPGSKPLPLDEELKRVLSHGVLHYCGYKDKSPEDEALMRSKEEEKMQMFHVEH